MKRQERIFLSPPHMGEDERDLLLQAFDSNWIAPVGPQVEMFEKELAATVGVDHTAALSSGTAGLHLALLLLNVKPGDEVVVSSLTFSASANAVCYLGARPVFIDSEPGTWNMDPDLLEQELADCQRRGKLPKAVIAVDIYGQCADYRRILPICHRFGVPLVEDAAEALGAHLDGQPAGSFGEIGVLSFNGNKIITCSGGGALISRNRDHVIRARHLATQARQPVAHYEHLEIGYNYRLSNLSAAVGRGQLRVLQPRVARKRAVNQIYREGFASLDGVDFMPQPAGFGSTCWLTCVTLDPEVLDVGPAELCRLLDDENIEARPLWKPMHLQPVFSSCRHRGRGFSDRLFETGVCLPSGTAMSDETVAEVIDRVRHLVGRPAGKSA